MYFLFDYLCIYNIVILYKVFLFCCVYQVSRYVLLSSTKVLVQNIQPYFNDTYLMHAISPVEEDIQVSQQHSTSVTKLVTEVFVLHI